MEALQFNRDLKAKLESIGIPFHQISVTRIMAVVSCKDFSTAQKWENYLAWIGATKISNTVLDSKKVGGKPVKGFAISIRF